MNKVKIAINGFGRIGRLAFRQMYNDNAYEIVAINDLTEAHTLSHLLKYDSAQKRFDAEVSYDESNIIVNGDKIKVYAEKDPSNLPWDSLDVDVVLECTGLFTSSEKATAHIIAGAKKVIISAPASGDDIKTIVYNVNHNILDGSEKIISGASCTTNCLAPMAKTLNDNFGIKVGTMTTIHAYTNDQNILDAPHRKDLRRARAGASNIVPNTTGAAKAISLVIPELEGKLEGCAQRVPVITGSLTELTCVVEKECSVEDINNAMKNASNESFGYNIDPIVSSDVIGSTFGSIFDATQTSVIKNGDITLVKVAAWYDNENSYTSQMVRTAKYITHMMK